MSEIVFESERLYATPLKDSDLENIKEQLQDSEVMYAYEGAFSDLMVESWLSKQKKLQEDYGFSLNGIRRKEDDVFVGQCGITMQDVEGRMVHEVGYLLSKRFWHEGYAIEMAKAARDYAFLTLNAPLVCSIVRYTNLPSQKVAQKLGFKEMLRIVKHYRGFTMPHIVFGMDKARYQSLNS